MDCVVNFVQCVPCREWIELLRMVRVMSEKKIRSLMEGEVDPHNAIGTIDLADIEAVQAINNPKKLVCLVHSDNTPPIGPHCPTYLFTLPHPFVHTAPPICSHCPTHLFIMLCPFSIGRMHLL